MSCHVSAGRVRHPPRLELLILHCLPLHCARDRGSSGNRWDSVVALFDKWSKRLQHSRRQVRMLGFAAEWRSEQMVLFCNERPEEFKTQESVEPDTVT